MTKRLGESWICANASSGIELILGEDGEFDVVIPEGFKNPWEHLRKLLILQAAGENKLPEMQSLIDRFWPPKRMELSDFEAYLDWKEDWNEHTVVLEDNTKKKGEQHGKNV